MRKLLKRLSLPLFFSAVVMAATQAPAQTDPMKQFTGPDGHFSVMMPGTPSYESQDVPLQGGAKAQMNEWYVEMDDHNVSYMLMYNDYPPAYANGAASDMLTKFRDGAVAGKTLLTDAPMWLGTVPGRAFTTKDSDGWLYDVHHFFLNKRLYQLIIVTAPGHTAIYRDQFMNSFKIQ
jgi:hypothetical protein